MRRIRYSVAMSLDSYSAGPKGKRMIDKEISLLRQP
jgi:hypothetical protein